MKQKKKKSDAGQARHDPVKRNGGKTGGPGDELGGGGETARESNAHGSAMDRKELENQNREYRNTINTLEHLITKYRDLYDNSPVGYFSVTREGLISEANLKGAELLGVPREKLLQQRFRQFVSDADRDSWDRHVTAVFDREDKQVCRAEMKQPGGATFHGRLECMMTENSGDPAVRIVMTDITGQVNAENEMRAAVEKYRVIFDNFPVGISITDRDGKIIETNRESERLLGISRDEHTARNYDGPEWKIIRPDGTPMPADEFASVRAMKEDRRVENVEMGIVKGSGDVTWINVNATPIHLEHYGVAITYGDISERKKWEATLEEAIRVKTDINEKMNEAQHVARIGSWEWDLKTNSVRWSDETYRIFGVTPEDYVPGFEANSRFIHPDDLERYTKSFEHSLQTDEPLDEMFRLVTFDGITKYCHVKGRSFRNGSGGMNYFVGTIMDITEYKHAEEARRESENRFLRVVENIPDVVVIYDRDLRIQYINNATQKITGRPASDYLGKREEEIWPPEVYGAYLPMLKEAFTTRKIQSQDTRLVLPGNAVRALQITCVPLIDRDGEVSEVLGITHDVTGRKAVEAEIKRKNSELLAVNVQLKEIMEKQEHARIVLLSILEDEKSARRIQHESEEKYRLLADNTLDVIWMMDLEAVFTYVNPAIFQMTGYTPEEWIGSGLSEHCDTENFSMMAGIIQDELALGTEGRGVIFESVMRKKNNELLTVEIQGKALFDDAGNPVALQGATRNITERKWAEKELKSNYEVQRIINDILVISLKEQPLEQLLQQSIGAIFNLELFSGEGCGIIFLSNEKGDTLELAAYKAVGERSGAPVPCESVPVGTCICGYVAKTGKMLFKDSIDEQHAVTFEGMKPHGHYCVPIKHEESVLGVLTLYIDDGHRYNQREADFLKAVASTIAGTILRKRSEAMLEETLNALEQKVAERTADLENANKELESFSYTVSHDLRAPLRHINGFMEMFRRETGESLSGKALHYMEVIRDSVRRMGQLIDDLLSFSRMGRAGIEIRMVDMDKLVDEVLSEYSGEIKERNIDVIRGTIPRVKGDAAMLRVILNNLVSNAIKFTRNKSNPRIDIGCRGEGPETVFYVKDNGAGFDMRYGDKLFGVFQRLHSDNEFEGTGIGLATVQRIIQRHGGRIWAEGEVGKGACFSFTLPAD